MLEKNKTERLLETTALGLAQQFLSASRTSQFEIVEFELTGQVVRVNPVLYLH